MSQLTCLDCDLWFTSVAIFNDHISGKRHRKRLETLKIANQDKVSSFECMHCGIKANSIIQLNAHLQSTKHTTKSQGNVITVGHPQKIEEKVDNTKQMQQFPCSICNITMNSRTQYDAHITSKKHKYRISGNPRVYKSKVSYKYTGNALAKHFVSSGLQFVQNQSNPVYNEEINHNRDTSTRYPREYPQVLSRSAQYHPSEVIPTDYRRYETVYSNFGYSSNGRDFQRQYVSQKELYH